ncbi:MAG TPA: biotin synthase BioB [Syntrophorhabdaceae bacterium]|nr:biotin synthase BioB [Syntrophorhabdaceae bacterium]
MDSNSDLLRLKDKAIISKNINSEDAGILYELGQDRPFLFMAYASEIREYYKGRNIGLCAIVNAKSGLCPENCRFCAQSVHHNTDAPVYPLISAKEISNRGKSAFEAGARHFGIVTSGTRISSDEEWNEIYESIAALNDLGMNACASLGMLDDTTAEGLKAHGLYRYHHNLETSASFFDMICSTHAYDEDIETVKTAKRAGLSVCSGGIIGLGEQMHHRIELALLLRDLDVDSVPINILNPIPRTPLADLPALSPIEILLTIGIFRFIMPDKDIRLCGGKERNLRQLLPLSVIAGCNSFMTGDYLTTEGRNTLNDLEMIRDLGLEAVLA